MWVFLQTSRGSKRSADVLEGLLGEERGTSDDAKRPKCPDARMLSHEEKLERRCVQLPCPALSQPVCTRLQL